MLTERRHSVCSLLGELSAVLISSQPGSRFPLRVRGGRRPVLGRRRYGQVLEAEQSAPVPLAPVCSLRLQTASLSAGPGRVFKVDCPCRAAGPQNNVPLYPPHARGPQGGGGTQPSRGSASFSWGKWKSALARGGDLALQPARCGEMRAHGHGKNANEPRWTGAQSPVPPPWSL